MRTMKKITAIVVTLMLAVGCMFIPGDKAAAATDMTAKTINYEADMKSLPSPTTITNYGRSDWVLWSITVNATGKLYVDAVADSSNKYGASIAIGTYSGSTFSYNDYSYVSAGQTEYGISGFDVTPGTYWVGIKSSSTAQARVIAYVIPYSTRTLPANKTMVASGKRGTSTGSAVDYKIVPPVTGSIQVTISELGKSSSSGYVTLLNSGKQAISDKLSFYTSSNYSYIVFGVKKGVTYYLRATGVYGSYNNQYIYGIKYTPKAATLYKNTKKSKSLNLKRKAKAKVVAVPATNKKKTQWYKFKVTKKRKTQIRVDASAMKSGSAKIIIYCGKKKVGSANMSLGNVHTYTVTHSTTYGKANKGKYYVKITTSAKCSGAYSVRYLK